MPCTRALACLWRRGPLWPSCFPLSCLCAGPRAIMRNDRGPSTASALFLPEHALLLFGTWYPRLELKRQNMALSTYGVLGSPCLFVGACCCSWRRSRGLLSIRFIKNDCEGVLMAKNLYSQLPECATAARQPVEQGEPRGGNERIASKSYVWRN
jgi:hypothetical protein